MTNVDNLEKILIDYFKFVARSNIKFHSLLWLEEPVIKCIYVSPLLYPPPPPAKETFHLPTYPSTHPPFPPPPPILHSSLESTSSKPWSASYEYAASLLRFKQTEKVTTESAK